MALSKLWTNYSAVIGASTYIDGITDLSLTPGLRTMVEAADGQPWATFGSLVAGAPTARFTTLDVKAALDAIGVTATAIPGAGVSFYFQSMVQGGTRSGSSAIKMLLANGIMVPRGVSASHQSEARISCEIIPIQSGATAPVAYSTGASIPGNTPGIAQTWTVGPVELNGTTIDGLDSIDIDFGTQLVVDGKDSDVYPSFASVRSVRPSARLKGVHADQITTLTADGVYYASGVVLYLKARAEGGTFIANATTSHIKFTLGKCRVELGGYSGDPKSIDMVLTPWEDTGGPTFPIAVATASAIT